MILLQHAVVHNFLVLVVSAIDFSFNQQHPIGQPLASSFFGVPGTNASFDYIVVGGGTAGLALAVRLAEANLSVAVVEAGGFYETDNANLSVVPGKVLLAVTPYTISTNQFLWPLPGSIFAARPDELCAYLVISFLGFDRRADAVRSQIFMIRWFGSAVARFVLPIFSSRTPNGSLTWRSGRTYRYQTGRPAGYSLPEHYALTQAKAQEVKAAAQYSLVYV